jgi:SAM-dependent methyltransferase
MSRPDAKPAPDAPPRDAATTLSELYAARFSAADREAKSRLWQVLWDAFFARYVAPDACVLDVGAGSCELINAVRARRRIAIDLNPDLERFAAPGVETHVAELSRISGVVAPGSVDVAFASNVLEHLRGPEALLDVLGAVRSALAPRGRLIIVQPNVRATGGAFWDFFDHTLPLTEKGMAEALVLAGFRIVESRARFLPYTTKSRLPQSLALVRLYLALRPAQWLLGKQMLIVAERT